MIEINCKDYSTTCSWLVVKKDNEKLRPERFVEKISIKKKGVFRQNFRERNTAYNNEQGIFETHGHTHICDLYENVHLHFIIIRPNDCRNLFSFTNNNPQKKISKCWENSENSEKI
ncbi:4017_t:CDS:2 [Funneliformis geosporum]|uniref:4017_t:CDS:1 n=1 Tax=Funneliformis geosporum TaxID=1117311 RepID=A0A9W4SGZ6_9GLOM|nr:4017_t:CDS:2 [Funneliformis geosporum]